VTKKTIAKWENSLEDDPALRTALAAAEALFNGWRAEAARTAEAFETMSESLRAITVTVTASGLAGMAVRTAAREALERADLADDKRASIEALLARFEQDFEALLAAKEQSGDHAFNAIISAVFLGAHVGENGDDKFRTGMMRSFAAAGGKASGEARRKNRPWVKHAEELARAGRTANPKISQDNLAADIIASWKLRKPKSPGVGTLKSHISEMERKGELARRRLG
jgi:hypothetical protein